MCDCVGVCFSAIVVDMALSQTYDSYGNQVHHLYRMDIQHSHCNDIAYQYMVHFHIGTYSKDTICQPLPHLWLFFCIFVITF